MKKRILIVDDEKMARDRIKRFLKSYPESLQILEAENGLSALEGIKHFHPDIVLLDIQMPVMSGFDVIYQLKNRDFQLIFQTAFDEFAVKAFEVNACDYLLKPFTKERLFSSIEKAVARLQSSATVLKHLEKHLENSSVYLHTLVSKTGSSAKIIRIEEILGFKSEDHYTFAITNDCEFILDNSLAWLESKLDPKLFVRTHRSSIVKINSVGKIGGYENTIVTLTNGQELPLSRENRKKVLNLFKLK